MNIFDHILESVKGVKGIFRDHSRDNALDFHKIRDFCILVMVLDDKLATQHKAT